MPALTEVVEQIKTLVSDIESELMLIDSRGFAYIRSKNIRKSAQELKLAAQGLRVLTSEEFNASKTKK